MSGTSEQIATISYRTIADALTHEHLHGTFFVGWPNRPSAATHLQNLRGSGFVVVAIDESSQAVVGFVTAISDSVLTAFIPLLEVDPAYHGRGIGSALMRRILYQLHHLYSIDLLCDTDLQPYYEQQGMIWATGMYLRNYDRQSGDPV